MYSSTRGFDQLNRGAGSSVGTKVNAMVYSSVLSSMGSRKTCTLTEGNINLELKQLLIIFKKVVLPMERCKVLSLFQSYSLVAVLVPGPEIKFYYVLINIVCTIFPLSNTESWGRGHMRVYSSA